MSKGSSLAWHPRKDVAITVSMEISTRGIQGAERHEHVHAAEWVFRDVAEMGRSDRGADVSRSTWW